VEKKQVQEATGPGVIYPSDWIGAAKNPSQVQMSTPPTSASNVQIRAPLVAYRISLGCWETQTIAVQELLWWV